jgi:hypothetical protein
MRRRSSQRPLHEAASTLLVSLTMIATLSAVTGAFILNVTSGTKTAHESASWRQAALAAESGANLAFTEIRRVLPDLNRTTTEAWSGWTSSSGLLPTGRTIPTGVTLSLIPPVLSSVGEGNTVMNASVTLDAPAALVDAAGHQWLRLRSSGTALVPGGRRVSREKLDNRLRQLAYVRDARLGQAVSLPQVTRTVEMIIRPVLPFRSAIHCSGRINVQGANARVDSFDSQSSLASTGGEYDSAKRRSAGGVYTNGSNFTFAGEIRGNVETNNGNVQPSTRIIGSIDNNSFRALPALSAVSPPSSSSGGLISSITSMVGTKLKVQGGTLLSPIEYRLNNLAKNLRITGAGVVDLLVSGDVDLSGLEIATDVKVRIVTDGNIIIDSNLKNESARAENLVIYALPSATGAARTIEMALDSDLQASIYAPEHDLRVTGDNDFMGSVTVRSLEATGSPRFHFDEALSSRAGRVIDYRIASWVEQVE